MRRAPRDVEQLQEVVELAVNISDDDDGRGHELHVRLPFQYFLDVVADARDLALAQRLLAEDALEQRVDVRVAGRHGAPGAARRAGAVGRARLIERSRRARRRCRARSCFIWMQAARRLWYAVGRG